MSEELRGNGMISVALVEAFSLSVLELQRLARACAIESFHELALRQVMALVPFAKAWWGRAAIIGDETEEHSYHLYNLPASYFQDWKSISHDDVTLQLVKEDRRYSVIVDCESSTLGLQWLGEKHCIGEFLFGTYTDDKTQLVDHLTLYREPGADRFTMGERLLLDWLMPHLASAVSISQIRTLEAKRESLGHPRNISFAVCDYRGTLHCAEKGFEALLLAEWPQWVGPQMPTEAGTAAYRGRHIELDVDEVDDLYLITASDRSLLHQLSVRESDVAQLFGEGLTYKEIARELGISPHTVRHHIRIIYSKLGVKDKASIAHLIHYSAA